MEVPTTPERRSLRTAKPRRRRWVFRLAAILVGFAFLLVVEGLLALFDVRPADERDDPYVGFDEVRPLFVLDEASARYEIPRSRRNFFAPESFPARKEGDTFRIFCLGGSTVQGRPYSKETSFVEWLQLSLAAAQPERKWETINCGGISYASYRLVPILEECLEYEPDLFIVCTGHNEFLEERTYGHVKQASPAVKAAHRAASRLRTYALLLAAWNSATSTGDAGGDKPQLAVDAKALLNYRNGLDAYHRDPEFRAGVVDHYEHNVRRMIAMANDAGVPVILIRPPSNLSGCPPFKSQHRDGLSPEELQRFDDLLRQARSRYRDDLSQSIELFGQALEIDGDYAVTQFELGRCQLLNGRPDVARESFLRARELDICPLRMIAPLEAALSDVAVDTGTPLLDAFRLLEAECPHGILGDDVLVDHVHPKIHGHQLIADRLTELMAVRKLAVISSGWPQRRDSAYQAHLDSLEPVYFARGLRELQALREWAAGRADEPEDTDTNRDE